MTSSQILCTSSNKEHAENAMDLKIGNNIIGKPEKPPRMLRKEDSQPSRRDGKTTLSYRETQREHGWALKYGIFLDILNTVDISYGATREERTRYHSQYVWRCLIMISKVNLSEPAEQPKTTTRSQEHIDQPCQRI